MIQLKWNPCLSTYMAVDFIILHHRHNVTEQLIHSSILPWVMKKCIKTFVLAWAAGAGWFSFLLEGTGSTASIVLLGWNYDWDELAWGCHDVCNPEKDALVYATRSAKQAQDVNHKNGKYRYGALDENQTNNNGKLRQGTRFSDPGQEEGCYERSKPVMN